MQRILIVSPDGWTSEAVGTLDPGAFSVETVSYADALRACRERAPHKVVVSAAEDWGEALLLIHRLWRLGPARPASILVVPRARERLIGSHSTLRKRADAYVVQGGATTDLAAVVEATRAAAPAPSDWLRGVGLFVALASLVVASPLLEAGGHRTAARAVALSGAFAGLLSEAWAWRSGRLPRVPVLGVGFLVLLLLIVAFTVAGR